MSCLFTILFCSGSMLKLWLPWIARNVFIWSVSVTIWKLRCVCREYINQTYPQPGILLASHAWKSLCVCLFVSSFWQVLDLMQMELVYSSSFYKSIETGGNVSQALVRRTYSHSPICDRQHFSMLVVCMFVFSCL